MLTYLVSRKPPSFPARDNRVVGRSGSVAMALYLAQTNSKRNQQGSYTVYAVEDTKLVRGATFAAGELVSIGQESANPCAWDWSD